MREGQIIEEQIRETVKQRICMMVTNAIIIIAFVVLAIEFDYWWIVFFSALFIDHEVKDRNGNSGGRYGKE